VPDETMFSLGRHGVKNEWRLVAEAIRANAEPSPYKKVYFTRTKLGFSGCIGEEYFEDFFRAKGFEIIAPETLSFKEQVSIVAGAEEFACTMGSVMLHMLYATPGSKLTVLNRSTSVARTEVLAAFVGDIETMYVDVFRNVLPDSQAGGSVWLLADNQHWRDYLAYRGWQNDPEAQVEYPLADNLLEYVKTWGWRYRGVQPYNWIKNEMLPDVVWRVNKYLRDEEVDVSQHHKPNKLLKLEDRVASQKAQMRTAWDLGGSYYDASDYMGDEMPEDAEALAYGSAPTYQIRRFTWAADNTLVLRFKIEHPWIQSGKMRPYIVLRKRLANKYANKLREWRGTQEELVLTPAIMSFKETGESYFSLQISLQQVYDLLKPAESDALNFYIRYICDEPARNSEERFGNVREKGTFAQYAERIGEVGGVAFYPYENAEKYLGFKILAPEQAQRLQQQRQNPQV